MADVLQPPKQPPTAYGMPPENPENNKPRLPPTSIAIPIATQPAQPSRSGHLNLDVFSPVNQNGSFEFDRVIRSGQIHKRSRKTRQWKKFFLVLRPNLLSMYKNESEEKLLKQINLSDLTAAAFLKDPKGRREHMFGLFTPSHNYQFQANNEKEAREWVETIRNEARIDEEDEPIVFGSPPAAAPNHLESQDESLNAENGISRQDHDRLASSSPEPAETPIPLASRPLAARGTSIHELDYSGQEHGSYSDFSDTAPSRLMATTTSASNPSIAAFSTHSEGTDRTIRPSKTQRNPSQVSALNADAVKNNSLLPAVTTTATNVSTSPEQPAEDPERVIWQGYLLCLKSKGGVRQWKRLWVVLRPKHMAFYKNEEEYSAHLLIPFSQMLSAIEIDPISRSKSHCMQIIAEERNYRFCAPSEEALARCLGALKSQLAKRKDRERRGVGKGLNQTQAQPQGVAAG